MIRVVIPYHLKMLAHVEGEVELDLTEATTLRSALDALEARYPMLRGTIRDQLSGERRPMIRFYACEEDLSNEPLDTQLPASVVSGAEPLLVIGAIAGG
jgi:sulfur-carrier protein